MRWALALFVAAFLGGVYWWTHDRPVSRPPGVLVAEAPIQQNIDPASSFSERGFAFARRARIDLSACVLRKEIYRFDGGSDLAPVDLALGWGPLSDSAIVDALEFSQMGRFFYWKPRNPATFPLPPPALIANAAQMHMIPATRDIEGRLERLRPGQLVTVGGYLVDVRGADGFTWNTSLTREDTGNGACEIVWVESLDVR